MSYQKEKDKRLDPAVSKAVNRYLFGEMPEEMVKGLDARTIFKTKESIANIRFHRLLEIGFGSTVAGEIADMDDRLLISQEGIGREQGVSVLVQHKGPKEVPYVRGVEEMVEEE